MNKTFEFNGPMALIVGLIAIIVIGIRLASLGGSSDPELEEKVRQELHSHHLTGMVDDLKEKYANDAITSDEIKKTTAEAIDILKIGTSRPLMSMSSDEKVVVHVRYMIPDDDSVHERYYQFKYGLVGGWRHQYETTVISYYLNLF